MTHPDFDPNLPPGWLESYSPKMTFFDLRSSDRASTPEQRRKIRRHNPNDGDVLIMGSYTRTKPIPKKDKKVEGLKLQHEYEISTLRADMERIRAEQRRLQTEVRSVRYDNVRRR